MEYKSQIEYQEAVSSEKVYATHTEAVYPKKRDFAIQMWF